MKTVKRVLHPERLRQVPEQFSWVDQGLVQRHFIDRCHARAAALYLFLVTVADAQGLSYYGAATLAQRLHLSTEELGAARAQLIELEVIAHQALLYPVRAPPSTQAARRTSATVPAPAAVRESSAGPVSMAQLLDRMGRSRARL